MRLYINLRAFLGGSVVKNLPAMQETQVQSLGQEDTLENEMATHSSILAWERGAWQAIVHSITKVRHDLATKQQCLLFKYVNSAYL